MYKTFTTANGLLSGVVGFEIKPQIKCLYTFCIQISRSLYALKILNVANRLISSLQNKQVLYQLTFCGILFDQRDNISKFTQTHVRKSRIKNTMRICYLCVSLVFVALGSDFIDITEGYYISFTAVNEIVIFMLF